MTVAPVPAGWYQDHQDAGLLRWWDGAQWTAHTQPRPGPVYSRAGQQAGTEATPDTGQPAAGRHERRPASKRDLHGEVDRLQRILDGLGVTEREQLAAEVTRLRGEAGWLRREHHDLSAAVVPLRAEMAALTAQRAQLGPVQ